MSKEKAIKYIKAAQTAIDEAPYPCFIAQATHSCHFFLKLLKGVLAPVISKIPCDIQRFFNFVVHNYSSIFFPSIFPRAT